MFFYALRLSAEHQLGAEMQKIKYDKIRKLDKIVFLALGLILMALVIQMAILNWINNKNTAKMSEVLLDRVVNVIEKNEDDEKNMITSLKEDYIVRAKAVAYIINANPDAEKNVDELKKIADLMSVDEIHLFDTTGKIYSGTIPEYYGYNFDSGDQMEYFKPMLEDKTLTMCQDVTPNTSEGKKMMYAITWDETGTRMVQVGIYLALAAAGIIYMYVKVTKAKIDELTGCLNRRAYKDDLNGMSLASEFVYAALDVNGLKGINDTLGHNAGDELIQGAAECMKQCFGSYGRVYRIGADEFVSIIFVDESELKKIREDFDEVISHWSGMMVDELSISCGYVYSREKNWESFDEIANETDLRMYEAKEKYYSVEGRDRRR